jgi:hypothetical protein
VPTNTAPPLVVVLTTPEEPDVAGLHPATVRLIGVFRHTVTLAPVLVGDSVPVPLTTPEPVAA